MNTLNPGQTLGPYRILSKLGEGGMGEVYRARDERLGRDVAIKVSAERFSDRFEREARAIASLNHPHICTLHDVGPNYLVMELVEGQTLADRLAQGAIPLAEAMRLARQIADALQTAHDRGIVHRDLKPGNIKITPEGLVKVLDFGLAKQIDPSLANSNPDLSPTMHPATAVGMILGTAAYMAPEQARGNPVDKRADVWAFGVVLYEMVTGRGPFRGDTVSDTMAAVLTTEPDWTAVPPEVRTLLRRCLAKDPKRRLRDIGDIDVALEASDTVPRTVPAPRRWLPWAGAALAVAALAPMTIIHLRERPAAPHPTVRFDLPIANLAMSGNVGMSPDGRHFGFLILGEDGLVRLAVRAMDSHEVRILRGSESVVGPPFFWSPDSRFIAIDSGGELRKVSLAGGPPQTIASLERLALGGSWNSQGDIIVGNAEGPILRLREGGGPPAPVTAIDPARQEATHLLPTFLPDGRHFIYVRVSRRAPALGGIYIGSLDDAPEAQSPKRLLPYGQGVAYAPSTDGGLGRLLYIRDGTLVAHPFDERRLELAGDPVSLADRVGVFLDTAFFGVSNSDSLVYRTADQAHPITWFDRQGNLVARISEAGLFGKASLSPDGGLAMVSRTNPGDLGNADLWLLDLKRGGVATRFTALPAFRSDFPVWSPDGSRVAFGFWAPGGVSLRFKSLDSASEGELLPVANTQRGLIMPLDWSPDGRFLLVGGSEPATNVDLWILPMDRPDKSVEPVTFARSRFNEEQGRFSPDGRWVAYVSNESGVNEIHVRAFNGSLAGGSASSGPSRVVSKGGGTSPRWRRDGKELFYLAADGRMMAVPVATAPDFTAQTAVPLFQAPANVTVGDVSADGQRFLLVQGGAAPFTVVLNWMKNASEAR